MFHLEQSLTAWREQMLAAGLQSPVPLEELESHLRDEIDRQLQAGLSEPDAFHAAVQNLGPAVPLKTEFTKTAGLWAWFGNDKLTRTNRVLGGLWLIYSLVFFGFIMHLICFIWALPSKRPEFAVAACMVLTTLLLSLFTIRASFRLMQGDERGRKRIGQSASALCGVSCWIMMLAFLAWPLLSGPERMLRLAVGGFGLALFIATLLLMPVYPKRSKSQPVR